MSDYIPPELIPNILARLPVEDVLRCTSVCKSWYSMIITSSFTLLHLKLSSQNQERRLLVKYSKNVMTRFCYRLYRDNQTFDEVLEFDPSYHCECKVIDFFNGLVCLSRYRDHAIVLWNPSLRKSLVVPESIRILPRSIGYFQTIGFGFVATSNEYKIVKISYAGYKTGPLAEIYTVGSGSWRDLKPLDFSNVNPNYQPAHLNGILHWSGNSRKDVNPTCSAFIYSFDLKSEKCGTLMIPSCLRHGDRHRAELRPSTFKESLRLIDNSIEGLCAIWEMKEYGVADSWERLFNIDKNQHGPGRFVYFRDNGEILFEKYCTSSRKLVSYDDKNNQVKNTGFPAFWSFNSAHTYVESLVLIKCPNEVYEV